MKCPRCGEDDIDGPVCSCGRGPGKPPTEPFIPEGIPRWIWFAAQDLRCEMERIDAEAMDAGQQAQDCEADEFEWCLQVAEIIATHETARDKIAAYRSGAINDGA